MSTPRVTKTVRFQVLRRDNHTCRYCGNKSPDVPITIDHVVPVALGGSNDPDNLVAACRDCNSGKAAIPPDAPTVEDVSADAFRYAKCRREAAQLLLLNEERRSMAITEVCEHWRSGCKQFGMEPDSSGWGDAYMAAGSVGTWLDRGLEATAMIILLEDYVFPRFKWLRGKGIQPWKHFAKLCWNRLAEIEDEAQALFEEGDAA